MFFFSDLFKARLDDCNGKKHTSTTANSTHEVGKDAKSAYADPPESGSSDNVSSDRLNDWISLDFKRSLGLLI